MELLLKVGNKYKPTSPIYTRDWRDGQIIEIASDGFYKPGTLQRRNHFVLTVPGDYHKILKAETIDTFLGKYINTVDIQDKHPWEFGFIDDGTMRRRDWFVDYKLLFELGLISGSIFDAIYNPDKDPGFVSVERDFTSLLKNEATYQRLVSKYTDSDLIREKYISTDGTGSGTGGGFTIGAAGDYASLVAFGAAIDAQLTGDLHGLHLDEETILSGYADFATDTNSHKLTITAEADCEHTGGAYGNGARTNFNAGSAWCRLELDEAIDGDLDDAEISKLAIDTSGKYSYGVRAEDGGNSGLLTIDRCLIKSGADNDSYALQQYYNAKNVRFTNNIVYGHTKSDGNYPYGIYIYNYTGCTLYVCNNTSIGNYNNFREGRNDGSGTLTFKNNLAQNDAGGVDYYAGDYGTTGHNVSEDATSPDVAYRSKDLHTNSVFKDYGNKDYRLDSDGDETNLAILDDGEDLSGTFTDDIQGQTRDTWYIGASEIVAAGVDVTATLDPLILTENNPTINKEVDFTAGVDALALTEYNATVKVDISLTAGLDALILTEYNPTVLAPVSVTAGVDELALTEYATTVNKEISLTTGIDELILIEYNPVILAPVPVTATLDTLILTEYNPTVSLGANIDVSATVDELALTEHAATIKVDINLTASLDELILTEYAVDVNLNVNVVGTLDELNLTEYATDVNAEISITAGIDELILTEYSTVINAEIMIAAGVDPLILSEYAANITTGGYKAAYYYLNLLAQ